MTLTILILIACIVWYRAWYNSPTQKGKRGEKFVSRMLGKLPKEYTTLNNLIFQTEKGTTQVDHVVVSKHGVFIIETKNYIGVIHGDDKSNKWTQVIITQVRHRRKWWKVYTYVTKNQFYNPVKQAYGHVYKIKDLLKDFPHLPAIPIVVFTGETDISKLHCKNYVICSEQLLSIITNNKTTYLNESDVSKVCHILQKYNIRHSVNNKTHVKNLEKARNEVRQTIKSGICPRCGGKLVQRKGKYGFFLGCSNYPNCKFTT